MFKIYYAFLLLLIVSCHSKLGPEDYLKRYVAYRFSGSQTKEALLEKTSGELKGHIANMGTENFDKFTEMNNFKKKKMKINMAKCNKEECFITYTLSYDEYSSGQKFYEIEVKKIAELVKEKAVWKVVDIKNVKAFMESKTSINSKIPKGI